MLYVLSGIPGSGKTTLAHRLAQQHNAAVHSYDDHNQMSAGILFCKEDNYEYTY